MTSIRPSHLNKFVKIILSVIYTSVIFTYASVIDIDGNIYETVEIGNQTWMAENLKVTHYNNGDEIPNITNNDLWRTLTYGAYAYYLNDEFNAIFDGALYNWHVVNDERNVCPEGWHVPNDDEFIELELALGMSEDDANNYGWRGENQGSQLAGIDSSWTGGVLKNDIDFGSSGFNASATGYRSYNDGGNFYYDGQSTFFWTTVDANIYDGLKRGLTYNQTGIERGTTNKKNGQSIRCVYDDDVSGVEPIETNYELGDELGGGYLFHINDDGTGLVAAYNDLSPYTEWGCYGTLISGGDGVAIGTGYQNTLDIAEGCSDATSAASATLSFVSDSLGEFNDWYLPSKDELFAMYSVIGQGANNIGGFSDDWYWTSTEHSYNEAYIVGFGYYGYSDGTGYKYQELNVRPIRTVIFDTDEQECSPGDVSNDGQVDVIDIVMIVDYILDGFDGSIDESDLDVECGDVTGDGEVNISDIVNIIHNILNPNVMRADNATEVNLFIENNQLRMASNGYVGGVYIEISHNPIAEIFLDEKSYIAEMRTHENKTAILIIEPQSELLFEINNSTFTLDVVEAVNSYDKVSTNIISEFEVLSAYPNPFNPATKIEYNVSESSLINISIYDINGRLVDDLMNEFKNIGRYSIVWDAQNFSSGIYFVKLTKGNSQKILSQKLMLVK